MKTTCLVYPLNEAKRQKHSNFITQHQLLDPLHHVSSVCLLFSRSFSSVSVYFFFCDLDKSQVVIIKPS